MLAISKNKELLVNDEIRVKEVRLIDAEGEQLGVVLLEDALRLSSEKNLDLALIAPQANPPVAKIMDYGKHLFEQSKKEKEMRKNQRTVSTKEVRLSVKIDKHDFDTKVRHTERFLKSGDKVKATIRFRGREMAHAYLAKDIMTNFAEAISEWGTVDSIPKLEGRSMIMMISPIQPQ